MKRRFLLCSFVLSLSILPACATLKAVLGVQGSPTSVASLQSYVSDVRWSLVMAHDQNWLNDADFTLGSDILNAIDAALARDAVQGKIAAQRLLSDFMTRLPPDSKLIPYFNWFVLALGN